VSDLKEPDGSEEDIIDNKIFGNIFHHAAENIYKMLMQRDGRIVADDIDRMLKTRADIERAVDAAFMTELFRIKDASRRMPPLDGLQIIHREVIIKYMHLLLETDRKLAPFTILGLEKTVSMPYVINDFTTNIGGIIDRLDCIVDSEGREVIRVVDYKTGSKMFKDMPDVEAIFSDEQIKNHSDYYLQTFLYSHIVRRKSDDRPVRPALLFIQHTGSDNFDPVLTVSKQKISDIAAFDKAFMTLFDEKVQEIFNPSIAFMPTSDRNRCRTCPYAGLCGF
jgi:ATP-dependent helicase/DNAse subunit B